jgi:phage antirepressor YoqD-like protein
MNLVPSNPSVTMTSIELVEFINSQRKAEESELRHDNFMAKVPKVLGDAAPKFLGTVKKPQPAGGFREYPCYRFPKREACLMAMSYSYELQAKVFDKMTELETKQQSVPMIPQTLSEALRLAADLADQKEKISEQLSIAAPKVAALERIADAGGSLGLQEAGKALQQKPNKFINWLRENGWIYRRAGSGTNLGRAEKVNAGYITHKVTTVSREDGSEKIVEQVLITPKGLARLAVILGVTANDSDMEGEAA